MAVTVVKKVKVNVSAAMCRLAFTTCGPECIAAGCQGNCCDAPSLPTGCMITIHKTERAVIKARGGVVVNGFLQPKPNTKGCPFKSNGLCGLHFTPDKPFGCIASPFTLNKNDTLIVRNRYKMLPCYRNAAPKLPAYKAFSSSLVLLFGLNNFKVLEKHLDTGGGNFEIEMSLAIYTKLKDNDEAKKKHEKV